MIRITGGSFRGRRLEVPSGIRPTTELARKAVFDILGPSIREAAVLDAAAGSGAYGLEALSRGAASAVFVESSSRVARVLRANVEKLGVRETGTVIVAPVDAFVARSVELYDVVFHDPPYEADSFPDVAALLSRLAPGGTLFHERGDDRVPEGEPPSDQRRYGVTRLLIYRRES